jgi:hypothetical protein
MDNYRVFVENLTCSVYLRDEVDLYNFLDFPLTSHRIKS